MTEQRLILLAIINARQTGNGITADSKLEIHASEYASYFDVSNEGAYWALKMLYLIYLNVNFHSKKKIERGISAL